MPSITSACTCSVDGVSGLADTRYKGYSFTGCGAHVEYKYSLTEGAGYDRAWCYVTSPNSCPGEDPFIPEGLKDNNTLPEWKEAGAAWKECYDGYRCEAWWGSLDGEPQGDPVVLDAPLDWPDCCALCSDTNTNSAATNEACAGWSFHPSTGSCQLMSDVSQVYNVPTFKGVNGTVNGYPGYFEAPVTGCWRRSEFDLCWNMNLFLLIPGMIFAFFGLSCVYLSGIDTPWVNSRLLRELLLVGESRLQKASCVKVSVTKVDVSSRKGGQKLFRKVFEGTFMTRGGALFVVSKVDRKATMPPQSRSIEQKMLRILFMKGLKPLAGNGVAARCQTPQGLRSEYSSLLREARMFLRPSAVEGAILPATADGSRDFDCLLVVGGDCSNQEDPSATKVLLVGILGEDRFTCLHAEMLGFSMRGTRWGGCILAIALSLLILFCVVLLTNEAAQVMAVWTFHGTDYRAGAVFGLVLCVAVPVALLACIVYRNKTISRLIQECPPAVDVPPEAPPIRSVYRVQTRDILLS